MSKVFQSLNISYIKQFLRKYRKPMEQGPACPLKKENPKLLGHRAIAALCLALCFTKSPLHTLGTQGCTEDGLPGLLGPRDPHQTCWNAAQLPHCTHPWPTAPWIPCKGKQGMWRNGLHPHVWLRGCLWGTAQSHPQAQPCCPALAQENTQTPETWGSDFPYGKERNINLLPPTFLATGLLC